MAAYDNQKLFSVLKELDVIELKILSDALEQSLSEKTPLDQLLLQKDVIGEQSIGRILGDLIGVPYVDLAYETIDHQVLELIPQSMATAKQVIAFTRDEQGVHLAMADPSQQEVIDSLAKKTGSAIIVHYAPSTSVERMLAHYKLEIGAAFEEIIAENVARAKQASGVEPPIIKIVDTILGYAYDQRASDVHIEPLDEKSVVRFRVDGALKDVLDVPKELHQRIITRIKVQSSLRTDEHQAAQDGKLVFDAGSEDVDVRVSIVPIVDGEKVVMRLLSKKARRFSLQDLGLESEDLIKIQQAYQKPHGMILATGPTGSGKTTTLYSILKLLNTKDVNIMTIEDPVEFDIERINQMQVNPKTELTFAKGLRSIVRQDPDIILVGEVRDVETAGISVNAAMTGHLVLSSLHTNDAATAFPRLYDLEVESFLVASTVNVVIAQRLLRKICQECKVSYNQKVADIPERMRSAFGKNDQITLYKGKGCGVCRNTGFVGRVGVFEVLEVDDELQSAIAEQKTAEELQVLAVSKGMTTMTQDGLKKVQRGITTLEEVERLTAE